LVLWWTWFSVATSGLLVRVDHGEFLRLRHPALNGALKVCGRNLLRRPIRTDKQDVAIRGVQDVTHIRDGVEGRCLDRGAAIDAVRSEEHTSELQSRFELVCRHLLETKK